MLKNIQAWLDENDYEFHGYDDDGSCAWYIYVQDDRTLYFTDTGEVFENGNVIAYWF